MPELSPKWEPSSEQPKKKAVPAMTLALVVGICGLGFVCLMPALVIPIFLSAGEAAKSSACVHNLRVLARANLMYAADFDEQFPGEGWMDGIKSYVDNDQELVCPVAHKSNSSTFGYALSSRVSRKKLVKIADQEKAALVFDSLHTQKSAIADLDSLPNPGRHRTGSTNNVAYVDGHVRGVKVGTAP